MNQQKVNYTLLKRSACVAALLMCVVFYCALQLVIDGTEPVFGGMIIVFIMLVLPPTVLVIRFAHYKLVNLKKGV